MSNTDESRHTRQIQTWEIERRSYKSPPVLRYQIQSNRYSVIQFDGRVWATQCCSARLLLVESLKHSVYR